MMRLWAGDLVFQIEHEPLQPFATGLEFFYFLFQVADFLSQFGGDFFFVSGHKSWINTSMMKPTKDANSPVMNDKYPSRKKRYFFLARNVPSK